MKRKRVKRKLSAEQIAKMQDGRKRAKVHKDRVAQLSDLDARLKNGERISQQPVRMTKSQRRSIGIL